MNNENINSIENVSNNSTKLNNLIYNKVIGYIEYKDMMGEIKTNLDKIPIMYEDNHLIVVVKPSGIPSQKDTNNDISLIEIIKRYIKEKYNKPGDVYLGLLHRLDTPTTGLMIFAKTSKAASRLSKDIQNKEFSKNYLTILKGNMLNNKGRYLNTEYKMVNYLKKNSKLKKSFVVDANTEGAKEAILYYTIKKVSNTQNLTLVDVKLVTGRHHQIRCQFANMGFPVFHDSKYDKKYNDSILRLVSYKLEFTHPTLKETITIDISDLANSLLNI